MMALGRKGKIEVVVPMKVRRMHALICFQTTILHTQSQVGLFLFECCAQKAYFINEFISGLFANDAPSSLLPREHFLNPSDHCSVIAFISSFSEGTKE